MYRIADPYLRFWYRYIFPNLSALEQELDKQVLREWEKTSEQHFGGVWEDCARQSVPLLPIGGLEWKQARRWWGKTGDGAFAEIDVVAESIDGSSILLGEVKWGAIDQPSCSKRLRGIAGTLPWATGKKIVLAFWSGRCSQGALQDGNITIDMVLDVLR